jgi:hypothetical protein
MVIDKLYIKNQSVFLIDVDEQKRFLYSLPEPRDFFESSYYQYLCQMKRIPFILQTVQNFSSIFLIAFYMIKLRINYKKYTQPQKSNIALFLNEGIDVESIPNSLKKEFEVIIECDFADEMMIGPKELYFIRRLVKRFWFFPYFVLKNILKISVYAAKIYRYNPKAIIFFNEYSFTSSLLTEYCHTHNVEHINIMHGEKLFNIRDSFVKFDRYFVWDEHYIKLMTTLRAPINQFRVEIPPSLLKGNHEEKIPIFDFTYYLGDERELDLLGIKKTLLLICKDPSRICVRYHPRYSDCLSVKKIFHDFQVENPFEITISESFCRTHNIVSLFSTVLFQAYVNKKNIVIDDLTNKSKYEKLVDLDYFMLKKSFKRVSDLIKV